MKFLAQGKVKDIYELDDERLVFSFSDRISAFNNKIKTPILGKGEVLAQFAEFWFTTLGVQNHYIERRSSREIVVRKLKMIPMECIVRGYFFGSFINRFKEGKAELPPNYPSDYAAKFPEPIFDPTTKDEFDLPVTKTEAIEQGLVTEKEYDYLMKTSIDIYKKMAKISDQAGFILADLKLEFGKIGDEIYLADSIGPDEYRLWSKEGHSKSSFDKEIIRKWIAENDSYDLPAKVTTELINKYRESYKMFIKQSS